MCGVVRTMSMEEDKLYAVSFKVLNKLQLNPTREFSTRGTFTMRALMVLIAYMITLIVIAGVLDVQLDNMVDVLNMFAALGQGLVKLIILDRRKQHLNEIYTLLMQLKAKNDIAVHAATRFMYHNVSQLLIALNLMYANAMVLMVVRSLLSGTRELPVKLWTPTGLKLGEPLNAHYVAYFALIIVAGIPIIMGLGGFDSFYVTSITHLAGQISILNVELATLFDDARVYKRTLKGLLKRQNLITICLGKIEELGSKLMMFSIFTNACIICMGLYTLNVYGLNITSAIGITMMSASTFQALLYCGFGQLLTYKLEDTSFAIYQSKWYENLADSKDVAFLLMKANKIEPLTHGGILDLNLYTFSEMMKKSFSFYALLQAQKAAETDLI